MNRGAERTPIAFFSYAHADDDNSAGRLTRLRMELDKALHVVAGRQIPIFQDDSDIAWGERWKERIDGALDEVSALIVVLSPSFFASHQCRRELERFLDREHKIGRQDLLLPIYWVHSPRLSATSNDRLGREMATRQWADWRELRHELPASRTEPLSARIGPYFEQLARRLLDAFRSESPDSDVGSGYGPAGPTPPPASPAADPTRNEPTGIDRTGDDRIDTASPTRVEEELSGLPSRLERLEEKFREGARHAADALERFADPEGLLEPADPDFITDSGRGLRPWLVDLTTAVAAGRRVEAAVGIRGWQELAADVEAAADRLVAANTAAARRSSELSRRLRSYRAMARARGLIEDPELTRLHAAALSTLRRIPIDLTLADRQITDYIRAVSSRGDTR